jgi:RimJ/RimL family protein N-acetyltransferase
VTDGPSVRLEPVSEAHLEDITLLLADADAMRFTRIPEPLPDGFARTWLERYEEGRADGSREAFAALTADGTFAGLGLAPAIDLVAREAKLGYMLVPGARGRGLATAILRLLTDWAFGELGILRAELIIDVENAASRRVAERCGYVLEGVRRSAHLKAGRRIDAEIWSRVASDPPA